MVQVFIKLETGKMSVTVNFADAFFPFTVFIN